MRPTVGVNALSCRGQACHRMRSGGRQCRPEGEVGIFDDASSISFARSVKYGLGVLKAASELRLKRMGLLDPGYLRTDGRKLPTPEPIDD